MIDVTIENEKCLSYEIYFQCVLDAYTKSRHFYDRYIMNNWSNVDLFKRVCME